MTNYEYIYQQVKKFHYSVWDEKELRKCVDMLPNLSRQELLSLYRSQWLTHEKVIKDAIFGYGKFIVLEMKDRFDSLDDAEKMKVIDTLSATTKANMRWAEGKRKQMNSDK